MRSHYILNLHYEDKQNEILIRKNEGGCGHKVNGNCRFEESNNYLKFRIEKS